MIGEMQNKTVAPSAGEYSAYKNQLEQTAINRNSVGISEAIKENSNIVDKRYKFY